MKNTRLIALLLALTLLTGALSACGKQNDTAKATPSSKSQSVQTSRSSGGSKTEDKQPKSSSEAEKEKESVHETQENTEPEEQSESTIEYFNSDSIEPDIIEEDETLTQTQTPAQEQTPTQQPQSEQEQTPEPDPEPEVTPEPEEPYSVQTADTVLTINDSVGGRTYYLTLDEIQSMGGYVEDDYFSRGKEPKTATTHFCGIMVSYMLDYLGISGKKVTFRADDGYAGSYSMSAVSDEYIDETVPGKVLYMILAWQEDYVDYPLRLVMGQTIEGEYNRTNWVKHVIEMDIKA